MGEIRYGDMCEKYILKCPFLEEKVIRNNNDIIKIKMCTKNNMKCHTVRKACPERCPAKAYIQSLLAEQFKNKLEEENKNG